MKDIQLFFFVNQGESGICKNHEMFTLKNKILLPKEIKYDVHQIKERLFSFTGNAHFYYRLSMSAAMDH